MKLSTTASSANAGSDSTIDASVSAVVFGVSCVRVEESDGVGFSISTSLVEHALSVAEMASIATMDTVRFANDFMERTPE